MKLTPLDIHHKEFRHSLRGYSEEEVDGFLDEVANDFERLFKENIELSERFDAMSDRLKNYQLMESTINHTLLTAQRSAEEVVAKAHLEAEALRREAESKAQEIIREALQSKQDMVGSLAKLKNAEEGFRSDYRAILETQLRALDKFEPRVDLNDLLNEPKASESAVVEDVRIEAPLASAVVEPEPVKESPVIEPPAAVEEPAAASVVLGEIEEPELPLFQIELEEPEEFVFPGLASLGEREDDIDIEEID